MTDQPAAATRLSRKEWALLALGLAVWIALGAGGVWLVHCITRPHDACGTAEEAQATPAKGLNSPGNSFSVLTGQGRCK